MDIEKWLCGLGLQQYVTTFRDNAIDPDVLSELTEADLEKLGVVLGHRKRLLRAIATLASPAALARAAPVGQAPFLSREARGTRTAKSRPRLDYRIAIISNSVNRGAARNGHNVTAP